MCFPHCNFSNLNLKGCSWACFGLAYYLSYDYTTVLLRSKLKLKSRNLSHVFLLNFSLKYYARYYLYLLFKSINVVSLFINHKSCCGCCLLSWSTNEELSFLRYCYCRCRHSLALIIINAARRWRWWRLNENSVRKISLKRHQRLDYFISVSFFLSFSSKTKKRTHSLTLLLPAYMRWRTL